MTALPSLVKDHHLIRRALNALEAFLRKVEEEQRVDQADLRRFVTFFRIFGDDVHQQKEEEVLLPALARAGLEWGHGPLADARREHRQERYFMRVLNQLAEQETDLDPEGVRRTVHELSSFLTSMRGHIAMEDEALFPLAQKLDAASLENLNAALKAFDESLPASKEGPRMQQLAEELIAQYHF